MKYIPILFSTAMVQAIIEGRKSMTRRVVKPQPSETGVSAFNDGEHPQMKCPYGQVGDILWVRESFISGYECDEGSFNTDEDGEYIPVLKYKADRESFDWYDGNSDFPCEKIPWKPSIHMPKSACRIFLKITNVRVERLQDISEEDAIAEGIASFKSLWQSINGEKSWDDNPWVWVIEFERIEKPENFI
ncbi:MAG: hypothetical protein Q7U77_11390 [Sediminibacterium sp.]|uniref:hypothetical protein n=1 Tax=Sediminibacterium sp. TaxID=1917865 RepID=UPI0027271392|nr:hypothetical protein [Sediminibacterium sp.]MDO8997221.1 hypothetical protein [Sediminibacterium sp.]